MLCINQTQAAILILLIFTYWSVGTYRTNQYIIVVSLETAGAFINSGKKRKSPVGFSSFVTTTRIPCSFLLDEQSKNSVAQQRIRIKENNMKCNFVQVIGVKSTLLRMIQIQWGLFLLSLQMKDIWSSAGSRISQTIIPKSGRPTYYFPENCIARHLSPLGPIHLNYNNLWEKRAHLIMIARQMATKASVAPALLSLSDKMMWRTILSCQREIEEYNQASSHTQLIDDV